MSSRQDQGKDHYFCSCGYSCRSIKLMFEHKKRNHEEEKYRETVVRVLKIPLDLNERIKLRRAETKDPNMSITIINILKKEFNL